MSLAAIMAATIAALVAEVPAGASEIVPPPAALVQAHSVTHPGERLTVRVPKSATYVGGERFDLNGVADTEVQVFVEAGPDKRMKKLYWIQFERYWPSKPDLTHNYTTDRRTQQWGTTTWLRSGPAAVTTPPAGGDRERVQAILTRAGYIIPPEVMNVRMIQLLDDPEGTGQGRNELMLIYSEDLALSGKRLTELRTGDKTTAAWAPIGEALVERATTAFSVERL